MSAEYIEYSSFDELCCDSAYYDGMCPETHQTECLQCPEPPNVQAWIDFYAGLTDLRPDTRRTLVMAKSLQLEVDSK